MQRYALKDQIVGNQCDHWRLCKKQQQLLTALHWSKSEICRTSTTIKSFQQNVIFLSYVSAKVNINQTFSQMCTFTDAEFGSLCWQGCRQPFSTFIKRIYFEKLWNHRTIKLFIPESTNLSASGMCWISTVLSFPFLKRTISNWRFDILFSPFAIDSFSLLVHVLWEKVISNLKEMSRCTSNLPTQRHCMMPQLELSINDDFRCRPHLPGCWLYLPAGNRCDCSARSPDARWAKMRQRSTVSTVYWQKANQNPWFGSWFFTPSQSCLT